MGMDQDDERPPIEDVGYQLNPDHLCSADENDRRFAVIDISRRRLRQYEPVLLKLLECEPAEGVRRHIIRALGNIGSRESIGPLLRILKNEDGLAAGDAAEALGKLRARDARMDLIIKASSHIEWLAQKCRWALKQIPEDLEGG